MLSNPLSTHLVSYLNSPSFSDVVLHPRCSFDPVPVSPSLDFHTPPRHNPIVSTHPLHPLRHSQSLTLPPPSFSPSASPSPSFSSSSPSLPPFTLDTDPASYAHRVILAGRSTFWLRLLSSLPNVSQPSSAFLPLCLPSLSPIPLISILPSTSSLLHLSLLVHPDALSLLLKYVYTGKIDLSLFSSSPPSRVSSPSSSPADLTGNGPSLFSLESSSIAPDSPHYSSLLTQQLLFYSRLFDLQPLYSALTVHFCNAAPRDLQLHLQQVAAVKADPAFASIATEGAGARSRFASAPFLAMTSLHYGHHQAARGVHVRVRAGEGGGAGDIHSERVEYGGEQWQRYKVDPLLFAARSGFFSAMFNADWKENQVYAEDEPSTSSEDFSSALQHDVVLEALSAVEFEQLLQFLYTDEMAVAVVTDTAGQGTALHRTFHHLAIDSRWTLRLMRESPAFTHLVSLLSFATMYQIPSMGELLQHFMAQHITAETVCAIWPLVLNAFFSPSTVRVEAEGSVEAFGVSVPSADGVMDDGEEDAQPLFTELEILHEACLSFTCQHFLQLARHPSFLSLPLALLKQVLDPGTVEGDSTGMIEALERWIEHAVEGEGLKGGGAEERKKELRLCLFPPSTLFNRSEKAHVMMGNRAFFTRFGWMPAARV